MLTQRAGQREQRHREVSQTVTIRLEVTKRLFDLVVPTLALK